MSKDGTEWMATPFRSSQTVCRNILRERPGPAANTTNLSVIQTFKTILSKEICCIIVRETNRKGKAATALYNSLLAEKFPNVSAQPPAKEFIPFTAEEFDAFLGILLISGVHKSNTETIEELCSFDTIPLVRAAMSKARFQLLLKYIRFDNQATMAERSKADKAAAIRDVWTIMDQKRIFLKDLTKQLCTMNIDPRINNPRITAQFSTRSAIEHVLGYPARRYRST